MEVINKSVPGQENQGSYYLRSRASQIHPLRAHNPNTWQKDLRQQGQKSGFKVPQQPQQKPTLSHRNYNSLPRMANSTSAAVKVQASARYVSKVFVEIGTHEDGHGDKSVSRSSSFLKRKKTKDIDESGVQDDSVIYSESKSSKLSATKRPSRRIESFNIRRPKHNETGVGDAQKKNSISSDLRRTSLNSSLNGSRMMDPDPASNGVSPMGRRPPPAWASYSEGLNRYRNGGSQGPGRPASPYEPPGTPQRGVSTSVVKNLSYQYSSSYNTPPTAGHRLYEAPASDGAPTRMDGRHGVHRASSLTHHDLQRTGSVTSHELEDLIEKYRGEEQPDGWSISSLVTTPPPLPKTPPPPAPRSTQLSVMPSNPSSDTIVMSRSPTQVKVHTKPYYNTSTQTDDLPPSPPPPAYEYPSSQVSYRSIEVQCDMDRDLMHTTVTKMSTLERRRTLKSDVSTQINQALAVLRDHQPQEYAQSTRGQQRPEPQVAAPVPQPTGQVAPAQQGQWQNPAKRFNIPDNQSDTQCQTNHKQKQIQDDILDKISEHSPSQTYMLRKLSQEFFKTKPGYGYINRLQDRTGSVTDSSRQGSTSDSSRPGSLNNYEIYSEINGASHSRSSSQSDYGSRLSLPQQHSIGEDSGMYSARTEDSGMFSARTSMSEPSSHLSYHDRSQSHSEERHYPDKPPSFRSSSPRQVRAGSQGDINSNYNQRTVHQSMTNKDNSVYVPSSYQVPNEKRQSVDHYENRHDQRVLKDSYSDTDTNEADIAKQPLSRSYNVPRNTDNEFYTKGRPESQSQGYPFSRGHKLSLKKAYGIFDPIDTSERLSGSMNQQSRSKSTSNVPLKASFANYVDVKEAKALANEVHGIPSNKDVKSNWPQSDKNQDGSQRLKRTSSEQLRPVKERFRDQLNAEGKMSQRILPDVEMGEKGAWESQLKELNQVEMVPRGSDHDYSLSSGESSRRSTSSDHRMSAGSDVFGSTVPQNPPSAMSSHSSSSTSSHEDRHRLSDPTAKKSTQQALLSFFERKTGKRLSTSSMESGGSAEKPYNRDSLSSSGRHERSPSPLKMQDLDKSGEHKKSWPNRSPSPLKMQDLEESREHVKKSKSLPRDLADPPEQPAPAKKHPMHKWGELFLGKKSSSKSMSSSASMDLGSLPSSERMTVTSSRSAGSMDGTWSSSVTEDDRSDVYSQPHSNRQEPEPMAPARTVTKQAECDAHSQSSDMTSSTSYQVTINKSYTEKDEEEDATSPPVLPPRNYRSHSSGTGFKLPKPLPVTPPKSPNVPKTNFDQTPKPDNYADQLRAQLRKLNNSQSAILKPYTVSGKFNLSTSRPVDRQPAPQEARAPPQSPDGKEDLSPLQLSPHLQSPTSPAELRSPASKSPRSPEVRPDHRPIQLTEPRPFPGTVLSPRLQPSESVSELARNPEGYDPRKETPRPWSTVFNFSSSVSKQERPLLSVLPDKASKESLQLKSSQDLRTSSTSLDSARFSTGSHSSQPGPVPSLPDLSSQMPRRLAAQKFQQLVQSTGVQETHFNAVVVQTVGEVPLKQSDRIARRGSRESLPGHERSLSSSSRDRLSQASNSSSITDSKEASVEALNESNTDTIVKEPYQDAPLTISPRPRPILSSSDNFEEVLDAEANGSPENEHVVPQVPQPKGPPPKVPMKKRLSHEERSSHQQTSPLSRSPQSSSEQLSDLTNSGRRFSSPTASSSSLTVFKGEMNPAKSLSELDAEDLPPPQKPPRRPRTQSREDVSARADKSKSSPSGSQDTPPTNRAMGDFKIETPPAFPDFTEDKESPRKKSPPSSPPTVETRKPPMLPSKTQFKYEPPVPEPSRPAPTLTKPQVKVKSQTDLAKHQEAAKYSQSVPSLIKPQWVRSSDDLKSQMSTKVTVVPDSGVSNATVPSENSVKSSPVMVPEPQSSVSIGTAESGEENQTVQTSAPSSAPPPPPESPKEPEKPWVPAVNHQRQKSTEEIEYELQAALVVRHLSPEEKTLGEVILPSPEYKTTASYLRKVYQVGRTPSRTNQATSSDKSSHLDMGSKLENIETLKKDLKERIEEKLDTLRTELRSIKTADQTNNAKGKSVTNQILQDNQGAPWLEKFKSVVDDTDSILKLLSNISARLARTENQMLSSSRMDEEKVELIDKKEGLEEKWGDAKMLKEAIDRRYSQVRTSLKPEEREAFQEYLEYKIVYAMERKEVEELLELGQDQLAALKSSLQDHDHS